MFSGVDFVAIITKKLKDSQIYLETYPQRNDTTEQCRRMHKYNRKGGGIIFQRKDLGNGIKTGNEESLQHSKEKWIGYKEGTDHNSLVL